MDFKGGVIIIGSLLWENTAIRQKWRALYLKDITTITPVKLKIRYGRQSSTRFDTYTMIFSNHPTTEDGQGLILGFKETIKSFRNLEGQAFAMAGAEGLWNNKSSLNKSWGTVGLLMNPSIDKKNKINADVIRKRWSDIYQNYINTFKPAQYSIENENPIIDKKGFLLLNWTEEMNDYDFLIATAIVPNVKSPLTAQQIAEKMVERNYFEYFEKNISNGIKTFQDEDIERLIKQK